MKNKLILLNILFVVGCGYAKPLSMTESSNIIVEHSTTALPIEGAVENWGMRWINNEPCNVPCWEGIIPGVTTSDQVVLFLKDAPIIEYKYHVYLSEYISWEWVDTDYERYYGYIDFDTSKDPSVVKFISIGFPSPLSLSDLVGVFGNPQIALMGWCNPFASYYLTIYFPINGILTSLPEASAPYHISAELKFSEINFHDQTDLLNTLDKGIFQEWRGYSSEYKTVNMKGTHAAFDSTKCLPTLTP